MFARVNIFQGSPEGLNEATRGAREEVLPAARELEGFAGMLTLADRAMGRSMGITFRHTEEALDASEEAAARIRTLARTRSMAHPNEAVVRRAYEAQARGDIEGYIDLLSEDFVLHIPGRSQIAGDYRGKEEVRRHFREIAEISGGTSARRSTTSWPAMTTWLAL